MERAKGRSLGEHRRGDGGDGKRTNLGLGHYLQARPFGRVGEQPIGGVRQPVEVKGARQSAIGHHHEGTSDRGRQHPAGVEPSGPQ